MNNHRLNWLDGLRGIAIIPVIIYHCNSNIMPSGFVGVDIFFIISGFIITQSVINKLKINNHFSIKDFFISRFKRIFPLLFFIILIANLIGVFILYPEIIIDSANSSFYNLFFFANFYFLKTGNYFNDVVEFQPLVHTWSLSVEEQFYFIFPLLFLLFLKKKYFFYFCCLFLIFFSLFGSQFSGNLKTSYPYIEDSFKFSNQSLFFSYYSTLGRIWEILFGVLLALNTKSIENFFEKLSLNILNFLGLLSFSIVLLSFFLIDKNYIYPSFITLIPVLATSCCIIFGNKSKFLNKLLSNKLLTSIGIISFSLYLIHQPLLVFFKIFFLNNLNFYHYIFYIIILFSFSIFTYKYIERRFHKNKISSFNQTFIFVLIISVLNLMIIFLINKTNGFEEYKYSKKGLRYLNNYEGYQTIKNDYLNECSYINTNDNLDSARNMIDLKKCIKISSDKKNILIWGDSHAMALNFGIRNNYEEYNISQITTNGCKPQFTINTNTPCEKSNHLAIEVIKNNMIDIVVIAQSKNHEKTNWDDLIEKIKTNKKTKFYLIGPTPQWIYPGLPKIYAKNIKILESIEKTNINLNLNTINTDDVLNKEYFRNLTYVSLIQKLCLNDKCKFKIGNDPKDNLLVVDQGHLSRAGSNYIAKNILNDFIDNYD